MWVVRLLGFTGIILMDAPEQGHVGAGFIERSLMPWSRVKFHFTKEAPKHSAQRALRN